MTPCVLSTAKPWGQKGYRAGYWRDPNGRRVYGAHRVALAKHLWEHEGRGILPGHHAAHQCNQPACIVVGPGHLYEATPAQNEADKRRAGRANRGYKLTPEARWIITMLYVPSRGAGTRTSATTLAAQFGVTPRTIYDVATGRTWRTEEAR